MATIETRYRWVPWALCLLVLLAGQAMGQRGEDDDFDDSGFDDSGYNNAPQNHDAEGSNQNQNYSPNSEEDLDDDDDVDETNMRPQVATELTGPQSFLSSAQPVALAGVPMVEPLVRYRRASAGEREGDVEDSLAATSQPLVRQRRHAGKYIGPVYTYVKTDKHAHYKWGVKHKVGKHYGR